MSRVRKIDKLVIVSQNVIPNLSQTPISNVVMLIAGGAPAIPTTEFSVNGKVLLWDDAAAGYDLEVGETVVADYEYDDGIPESSGVYNPSSSTDNPVLVSYTLIVAEEDIVPKLIHVPVADTFVLKVNNVTATLGVDYTRNGKTVNWISATTLNVEDEIYVEYRKSF